MITEPFPYHLKENTMRSSSRWLPLLALFAGITSSAAAQEKLLVGPIFGINSSKIIGDNQEDASRRTGLRLGGFLSYSVSRKLSIQPEFAMTSKGTKWVDDDAEIKINYIQVPVLARLRFPSSKSSFAPYVMAGPAFAFKSGCSLIVEGQSYECSSETTAVAGSDFGLVFGAGAELGHAQFSLRYDMGLKNINGDGEANVKNRTVKLAVGYGFRIGK
jgi:Outer membrane protein beta-barrel domain